MGYNMAFTNSLFILGISHSASHAFGGNTFGNLGEYALLYISKSDNFTYTYYTQLKPPDNQLSTLYGYAVAASGNDYIISMPNGKSTDGNNGAVYFGNIKE